MLCLIEIWEVNFSSTLLHFRPHWTLGVLGDWMKRENLPWGRMLADQPTLLRLILSPGTSAAAEIWESNPMSVQYGLLESTFLSCAAESYNLLLKRVEAAVDTLNLFLLKLLRFYPVPLYLLLSLVDSTYAWRLRDFYHQEGNGLIEWPCRR